MNTAVLLLFFNRPAQATEVLKRVRKVQPPRLYLHVDGPRPGRPEEAALVEACRNLQQQIDWPCEVHTLFRPVNLGLRAGVYDALNWFFDAEECGIILEDDCLPDESFFQYCETLLEHYKSNEAVMHIAGSNVASKKMTALTESFFGSRFSLVWGWASWRRAWKKMTIDLDGLDEFIAQDTISALINLVPAQVYMLDKFKKTRNKQHNSWAYAWFYSILKADGCCIVPAQNLVENTGIGIDAATNTSTKLEHLQQKACSVNFPLNFPKDLSPRAPLEKALFFHTQKQKWRLWLWYLLYKIGLR